MNSASRYNMIVFIAEKISSIGFIWVGLALGLVIYDYTQLLYLATISVSFISSRDSIYIAKYQTLKIINNTSTGLNFLDSMIVRDKFMEKIISRALISFFIIFIIYFLINNMGIFNYLKIDEKFLNILMFYIFVENFSNLLLQYHRYQTNIISAYKLRVVYLFCKIFSFVVALAYEDLVISIWVYGFLILGILIWLININQVRWFNVIKNISLGFSFLKIKDLLLMGFIGLTSGLFVGFDRFVIPGYLTEQEYLESFARLKFFLGFISLIIPFVGFWLSPAVNNNVKKYGKISGKLARFVSSLMLYIGFSVIIFANLFYIIFFNENLELFNIRFILILCLLCGITTLNLLLNVCFFNINTSFYSRCNTFMILLIGGLFFIIGPSDVMLLYSALVFCFGFLITGFFMRKIVDGMFTVIKFLFSIYFIFLVYLIFFNITYLFIFFLSSVLIIYILARELSNKFESFHIFLKGM